VKILHVITTIDLGGAEKHLLELSREQRLSGLDVTVAYLKGQKQLRREFINLGIHLIDLSNKSYISQIFLIRKFSQNKKIVHAHLPRAEFFSMLAILFTNRKFVVTRHNTEKFWPKAPTVISSIISRLVTSRAEKIIAISKSVDLFLKHRKEVAGRRDIDVIYYGISLLNQTFDDNFRSDFHEKGVVTDKFGLLCIARFEFQKDHETLFRAICELNQKNNQVDLTLIGRGSLEDSLRKLARDLKIYDQVQWKKDISDVSVEMENVDALVLPSRYEGFGLVLLEAIANNLPIIASDADAIQEVLGSSHPGLFSIGKYEDLSKLIEKLSTSKSLRKRLLAHQQSRKSFFSSTRMHQETLNLYLSLQINNS
jgi:glycosyltransferase involved in cell wall biosynthesis